MSRITNLLSYDERSQLENTFISRELLAENEAVKQPQRDAVLAYILDNHARRRMVFAGLPGVRWAFERMLDEAREPAHNRFIGMERNFTLLKSSLSYMPGGVVKPLDERILNGWITGWRTDRATGVWSQTSAVMGPGRKDKGGPSIRQRWSKLFKHWTAAWLDFSSQLCDEVVKSLQRVDSHCDAQTEVVPVAITLMLARELPETTADMNLVAGPGASTLEKRAALVSAILNSRRYRSFERDLCWDYTSVGGVPMGVITGRMILRKQYRDQVTIDAPVTEPVAQPADARPTDGGFPEGAEIRPADEPGVVYTVIGYHKDMIRTIKRDGNRVVQRLFRRSELAI